MSNIKGVSPEPDPVAKQGRKKAFLVGLALAAIIFPVVPLLDHLGRPELKYPVIIVLAAIAVAIRARGNCEASCGSGLRLL